LTEEKDAIFLLVSYQPSQINFLRDWTIKYLVLQISLVIRHTVEGEQQADLV
jgi:hypothetical protein